MGKLFRFLFSRKRKTVDCRYITNERVDEIVRDVYGDRHEITLGELLGHFGADLNDLK